jgi:hypothetical protein
MRHYAAPLAFLLITACGSDGDGIGPGAADVSGSWQFRSAFGNETVLANCQAAGEVFIQQSGSNFTGQVNGGQGVCTSSVTFVPTVPGGSIAGGRIDGSNVSYTNGPCDYTGVIAGNARRMSGGMECALTVGEAEHAFTGTWEMTR